MSLRLGVLLDDLTLGGAKLDDPVDVVVIRSTFLNPPRAAAAKRQAEKILALIDDSQRAAEMGRIGRHRVETELSWDYQVEPLIAAYRRATEYNGAR